MTQLVIKNLEDDVTAKLQNLARDHGRTVEEEVRGILREAVSEQPEADPRLGLGSRIAACFAGLGFDQEIPELRGGRVQVPDFDP
jgi:plasmid stability protein